MGRTHAIDGADIAAAHEKSITGLHHGQRLPFGNVGRQGHGPIGRDPVDLALAAGGSEQVALLVEQQGREIAIGQGEELLDAAVVVEPVDGGLGLDRVGAHDGARSGRRTGHDVRALGRLRAGGRRILGVRRIVEVVDSQIDGALAAHDGPNLVGVEVVQGLGAAIGVHAVEQGLARGTRQERIAIPGQRHHVFVSRIPIQVRMPLGVDGEDLPAIAGGGVGPGTRGIVFDGPYVLGAELGEHAALAGLGVDGEDAPARGRAGQQASVGPHRQGGDPRSIDLGEQFRATRPGGRYGKDASAVAGAEVRRAPVARKDATPRKRRVDGHACALHAGQHLARGRHHGGRGLPFLEVLGCALAK